MYEYRRSEDINTFMEIASFSFAVKKSRHELLRKYISEVLASGAELYTVHDGELMVAGYILYPFKMKLRDSMVTMGGIGLVCSRADFRGKGTIRFMLENAVKTMYEEGIQVSVLYPFNVGFYRKYGWEVFFKTKRIVIHPGIIDAKPDPLVDYCYLPFPDNEVKDFYNEIAKRHYNLAFRNDYQWRRHLMTYFSDEASCGVVKFKHNGKTTGMLTQFLSRSDTGYESSLTVKDFFYTDRETKDTMLAYLKSLSHQIKDITLVVPENFELWPYLNDRPKEEKLETSGMIRIINLKSLNGLGVDFELPTLKIKVRDRFLKENSGTFALSADGKKLMIQKTEVEPELECDIASLSVVLSGLSSFAELIEAGQVKVLDNYKLQDIPKSVTFHSEPF
ncbi:GNAT family N-acetyltransferase [Kosmotoga pacifica]|uniref:N-acetyltransferase domain-containing protein n=1 Tax=Kosmotoga pacifica TaxID=1330330 RepID=A0A0G2ZBR4_9BACT|nr:GNAT family N-acetyltransferase [Kosmotoga pacifica]AKI97516.1 hypothetical protein IX53_06460 [Kosmotoga pacifica]